MKILASKAVPITMELEKIFIQEEMERLAEDLRQIEVIEKRHAKSFGPDVPRGNMKNDKLTKKDSFVK